MAVWLQDAEAPQMTRFKLARPREVPILKLLGWEECGDWSQSFVLMQFISHETATVDLRRVAA